MTVERARVQLELRDLRLLIGIAETSSIGGGARLNGLAQPNASRTLTRIERELGLVLFSRSPAGARPTAEGALLVQWAKAVVSAADQLDSAVEALRADARTHVPVAASMTVAEFLLPRWLTEFARHEPDVRVDLEVHNSQTVCDLLLAGRIRVGFIESPDVPSGLHSVPVGRDRLVVVVAPGHPWARRRRPVEGAELAATRLVVRESGSGTRETLDRVLAGYDPAPPISELPSNTAVRLAAAAGMAPAALSHFAVEQATSRGELHVVKVEGVRLERTLRAVWAPPRRLDGPAGDLVQIARGTVTP